MNYASDPFSSVRQKAHELISQMTLEEKIGLCSGADFWHTHGIERLHLAPVTVTDGPHGLRKQKAAADHLGINESVPATCFPPACTTACSFDSKLMQDIGTAMGEECLAEEVAVILGPAANIKRSPLCGRNFEYFSEDPLLSGRTAAGLIRGIQSQNVGTSLKHYLANNQEKARLVSNSVIDERALREIYLAGFELAVAEAQPWTLMCSYNQINGTYASDNKRMMTDIPRGEWGYQGAVITDWGAMNDRIEAIKAGLDLEMPGPCEASEKLLLHAVQTGLLEEADITVCAERITALLLQAAGNKPAAYDIGAHDSLACRAAQESAVLLKNDGALPASPAAKTAVIGAFAKTPRYQGAGSSKIAPHRITSLCDALDKRGVDYNWCTGYLAETDEPDWQLIDEAVETARNADIVFVCVGLPDRFESEGFDRTHLAMPANQNALVDALCAAGKPVVAVLHTGSVVEIPWRDKVNSILLLYLTGQNGGTATANLLFGDVNPSGKLSETWPLSLADVPCADNFGHGGNIEYRESIYVGYRYYDKAQKEVAYPFGHGLSYTEFDYSALHTYTDGDNVMVDCTIANTGAFAGSEVVQLYVASPQNGIFSPVRELRDYTKLTLEAGACQNVTFTLPKRAFAYYNVNEKDWTVQNGIYTVEVASSSRDIRLTQTIDRANGTSADAPDYHETAPSYYTPHRLPFTSDQFEALLGTPITPWRSVRPYTMNTTFLELKTCAMGRALTLQIEQSLQEVIQNSGDIGSMLAAMVNEMPLRQLSMLGGPAFSYDKLCALLTQLNEQPEE